MRASRSQHTPSQHHHTTLLPATHAHNPSSNPVQTPLLRSRRYSPATSQPQPQHSASPSHPRPPVQLRCRLAAHHAPASNPQHTLWQQQQQHCCECFFQWRCPHPNQAPVPRPHKQQWQWWCRLAGAAAVPADRCPVESKQWSAGTQSVHGLYVWTSGGQHRGRHGAGGHVCAVGTR